MSDCLFCKIIAGAVPSQGVYDDEFVYAFRDVAPQTPVHILVVPKMHLASAAEITGDNSIHAAKCLEASAKIAKNEGLGAGYRVITNVGADGGQTVKHLHFHILGGKALGAGLV